MSKNKIRTVIVDDEPNARKMIRTLLSKEKDFEVVAECKDGEKAIKAIETLRPDLVFLDVQMPGADGFDVLLSLNLEKLPVVVFVTAYDKYAVRAFKVHALDYLLKPFDDERFSDALDRVREEMKKNRVDDMHQRLKALISTVKSDRIASDRLLIKSAGRITFLPQDKIDWIEAAGNYLQIHVGKETHLVRGSVTSMEEKLLQDRFVRIHRSTIVNFDRVKEMTPSHRGEFEVVLVSGERLALSRRYREKVEMRLGKPL